MKIAVAADEDSLDGVISGSLNSAKALLIIEMDDDPQTAKIIKCVLNCTDTAMAKAAAAQGCEAVISGALETEAFNILADAQITRYNGAGLKVFEGIRNMQLRRLDCFTRLENETDEGEHACGHDDD